ncbi:MAG: hypothetical protein IPL59_02090 [Candidatus Competibacteraceae bacterium]|nr:hypothetical protein [Candidatus Competibacteraceae bacterium]
MAGTGGGQRLLRRAFAKCWVISNQSRTLSADVFGIETCRQEQTLEEIGQQFGVTRERIRQIEAKGTKKNWLIPIVQTCLRDFLSP